MPEGRGRHMLTIQDLFTQLDKESEKLNLAQLRLLRGELTLMRAKQANPQDDAGQQALALTSARLLKVFQEMGARCPAELGSLAGHHLFAKPGSANAGASNADSNQHMSQKR